jgi:hypothetical protein
MSAAVQVRRVCYAIVMVKPIPRTRLQHYTERFTTFLASRRCFYVVVAIFAVQAVWFAVTARYPMAFDEDFHFGLIQLHASQWLPFFTSQPPHADQFGAVVRDPSYLYHYLMSIPYRGIALFTSNTIVQIIALRFVNIGLAVWGLFLSRRLLQRLGGGPALINSSLLLFAMVPIVPFLAAHINYDNLFILLTLGTTLMTFDWLDKAAQGRISAARTILLLSLLTLACLVKYAFLPIAAALGAIMIWQLWRQRDKRAALASSFIAGIKQLKRWQLAGLCLIFIASAGLFSERYVVNVVQYHSLDPDCAQILSVSSCLKYSPWARDYQAALAKPSNVEPSKLAYVWEWLYGMWLRSFFAISDTYDTQPPLPVPGATVIVIGGIGLITFAYFARRLLKGNLYRQTVVLALLLYLGALFAQTFETYMKTDQPVAINGRYLLPFLPIIILLVGLAYSRLWRHKPVIKAMALTVVLILFIQGGGILTFILRSNDTWYWPNNTVVTINSAVREALRPFIIGARL